MSDRRIVAGSAGVGMSGAAGELWIFGYGSLMWRPDFAYEEAVHARVDGWRRGFFIYSTHHRGSHAKPGLVLALDRGGSCEGIAFRVAGAQAARTLAYLRAREQVSGVYIECALNASLLDGSGRLVRAVTFVAERRHPSYAGRLCLKEQAHLIRAAAGISGANYHYLASTVLHLEALGIREPGLLRLLALAGPHFARKIEAASIERAARSVIAACSRFPARAPLLPRPERRRFLHRKRLAEWALEGR
jgi:cation transport protein ChaC